MRTSAPCLPSGRRFASTSQIVPSGVAAVQARISPVASEVAAESARDSSAPSAASATKITSTSLT